jgi:hypothetical protein
VLREGSVQDEHVVCARRERRGEQQRVVEEPCREVGRTVPAGDTPGPPEEGERVERVIGERRGGRAVAREAKGTRIPDPRAERGHEI